MARDPSFANSILYMNTDLVGSIYGFNAEREYMCVTIFASLLVLRSLVCFLGGFARGISLFLAAQIPWPRCLRSFLHMQCQDP